MRFIFFTKTNWNEIPRFRHQLAKLLINDGHKIIFFQKPNFFFQRHILNNASKNKIKLVRHKQLIHHRLRFNSFIHNLNSWYEKKKL
jgi:hypothetical protein